jgi:integrase
LSIKTKYIQKRGNIYQFAMRIPSDLIGHYGQRHIRLSLQTDDPKEAAKKAESLAKNYNIEFATLREDSSQSPRHVLDTAERIAERYATLDAFVDNVAEPKRREYSGQCWDTYEQAPLDAFLTPIELETLRRLQHPDELRLSGVFAYYERHHKKAGDEYFMGRARAYWDQLIEIVGDIPFSDLNRTHSRAYVTRRLAEGKTTGTVRRGLRQLHAIAGLCIRETETNRSNPFQMLDIPNEGKDAKKRTVPPDMVLKQVASKFLNDPSPTALIILMQMETGARVGEIAGLALSDVVLDHEVPHIDLKASDWRSLKTDNSERTIPLVGVALHAAQRAVKAHSGNHERLFPKYAKPRGSDTASAAINKRLKHWGITSHSFRHAMKDRLKEADVTQDLRGAIQGHGASDMDNHYGKGYMLHRKQEALLKVAVNVEDLKAP